MLTHGVISNDKLLYSVQYPDARRQLYTVSLDSITTLENFLGLALQHNLHTLWVVPSCKYNYWGIEQAKGVPGWEVQYSTRKHPVRGMPDLFRGITAKRQSGTWEEKRLITMVFPEDKQGGYCWDPDAVPASRDPLAVLAGIHYLEAALGVQLRSRPGMTGRTLIEECNSTHSRPGWLAAPSFDLRPLGELGLGYDFALMRGVDAFDMNADVWLHCWDKNSMYLGACSSVELGTGNPVYINSGELDLDYEDVMKRFYDGKRPGYWRVDVEDFHHILNPLYRTRTFTQEWVTTPLLKLLFAMGARLRVREAYVWTEHHRVLDTFATKLWDARQSLKTDAARYPHAGGRAIAYHSIKRVATAAVGLLANGEAWKYARQWYRPDWHATVVEDAKCRLIYKLLQVERTFGVLPEFASTDKVGYWSPQPDPAKAFPGMFERPDALGGWKLEESLPCSYALLECFKEGTSAATAAGRVRKLAELTLAKGA